MIHRTIASNPRTSRVRSVQAKRLRSEAPTVFGYSPCRIAGSTHGEARCESFGHRLTRMAMIMVYALSLMHMKVRWTSSVSGRRHIQTAHRRAPAIESPALLSFLNASRTDLSLTIILLFCPTLSPHTATFSPSSLRTAVSVRPKRSSRASKTS